MRNLKVILALGGSLLAAVAVACSSSSPKAAPAPVVDAGEDAATPQSCIPLSAADLCPPATGQTCCFDLTSFSGTCVAQGSCTTQVQVACVSAAQCGASQVCCADFGGALGALEDSGLAGLGIDASTINLDAGASLIPSNVNFKVTCATSCTSSQIQACATDQECVGTGATCVPLSQLLGDAGTGDAGIPPMFAQIIGSLGMEKACLLPDAGINLPPVTDSGSDAATVLEAGPVDGGNDGAPEAAAP